MELEKLLAVYRCTGKTRIGPRLDGGYIMDSRNLSDRLVSVGCDNRTDFESGYLKLRPNSSVTIYDNSGMCDLADQDNRVQFIKKHVTSIEDLNLDHGCVVAMDIESHEIELIEKASIEELSKIRQLAIEFHFFDVSVSRVANILKKLNQIFKLIHIHGNNFKQEYFVNNIPKVLELTYVNNVLYDCPVLEACSFPVPNLDYANNPRQSDFELEWVNRDVIKTGRIFDEHHPDLYKKWVVGGFVKNPDFNNSNFEFKFQNDKKGMCRQPKTVMNPNVTTLAILIDGHVRMNFGAQNKYLRERGDYIWWCPDVPHLFEYLEDSLVITLRWI